MHERRDGGDDDQHDRSQRVDAQRPVGRQVAGRDPAHDRHVRARRSRPSKATRRGEATTSSPRGENRAVRAAGRRRPTEMASAAVLPQMHAAPSGGILGAGRRRRWPKRAPRRGRRSGAEQRQEDDRAGYIARSALHHVDVLDRDRAAVAEIVTRMARPMAASAAATVSTSRAKTCPTGRRGSARRRRG